MNSEHTLKHDMRTKCHCSYGRCIGDVKRKINHLMSSWVSMRSRSVVGKAAPRTISSLMSVCSCKQPAAVVFCDYCTIIAKVETYITVRVGQARMPL